MLRRPSVLYRRLRPTASLFRFTLATGTVLGDDAITSVTIKRGSTDPGGGVSPSTLEIGLSGYAAIRSGEPCEFALTGYGAQLLAGYTGANANVIQPRFSGRVGKQTVDDQGLLQFTTILAASWTAQLGRVKNSYHPSAGTPVGTVLDRLLTAPALPALTGPVRLAPPDHFGTVFATPDEPLTYSDIDAWTTDLGVTVRETRAGGQQIMSHQQRMATATDNMDVLLPVLRSEALSPATWEQASETTPRNQRVTWGSGAGTNSDTWGDLQDPYALVVDHDMTHVKFNNEGQPRAEGYRLRALEWESSYSLPTVNVDLGALISSPRRYDQYLAADLMAMEVGAAVYLSGDWHHQLAGIHFATAITETITPAGWRVSLSLAPSQQVVGEVSPTVPARAWDSATYPWSDESRSWANA